MAIEIIRIRGKDVKSGLHINYKSGTPKIRIPRTMVSSDQPDIILNMAKNPMEERIKELLIPISEKVVYHGTKGNAKVDVRSEQEKINGANVFRRQITSSFKGKGYAEIIETDNPQKIAELGVVVAENKAEQNPGFLGWLGHVAKVTFFGGDLDSEKTVNDRKKILWPWEWRALQNTRDLDTRRAGAAQSACDRAYEQAQNLGYEPKITLGDMFSAVGEFLGKYNGPDRITFEDGSRLTIYSFDKPIDHGAVLYAKDLLGLNANDINGGNLDEIERIGRDMINADNGQTFQRNGKYIPRDEARKRGSKWA